MAAINARNNDVSAIFRYVPTNTAQEYPPSSDSGQIFLCMTHLYSQAQITLDTSPECSRRYIRQFCLEAEDNGIKLQQQILDSYCNSCGTLYVPGKTCRERIITPLARLPPQPQNEKSDEGNTNNNNISTQQSNNDPFNLLNTGFGSQPFGGKSSNNNPLLSKKKMKGGQTQISIGSISLNNNTQPHNTSKNQSKQNKQTSLPKAKKAYKHITCLYCNAVKRIILKLDKSGQVIMPIPLHLPYLSESYQPVSLSSSVDINHQSTSIPIVTNSTLISSSPITSASVSTKDDDDDNNNRLNKRKIDNLQSNTDIDAQNQMKKVKLSDTTTTNTPLVAIETESEVTALTTKQASKTQNMTTSSSTTTAPSSSSSSLNPFSRHQPPQLSSLSSKLTSSKLGSNSLGKNTISQNNPFSSHIPTNVQPSPTNQGKPHTSLPPPQTSSVPAKAPVPAPVQAQTPAPPTTKLSKQDKLRAALLQKKKALSDVNMNIFSPW